MLSLSMFSKYLSNTFRKNSGVSLVPDSPERQGLIQLADSLISSPQEFSDQFDSFKRFAKTLHNDGFVHEVDGADVIRDPLLSERFSALVAQLTDYEAMDGISNAISVLREIRDSDITGLHTHDRSGTMSTLLHDQFKLELAEELKPKVIQYDWALEAA